jgi:hypothetical protein
VLSQAWECIPIIPATQEAEAGGSQASDKLKQSYQDRMSKNKNKRAGGRDQMVEHLPNKYKALKNLVPPKTKR